VAQAAVTVSGEPTAFPTGYLDDVKLLHQQQAAAVHITGYKLQSF
jgi:hypothetical protein